jgi:5S rRNA maturation endonuclease (ribonuclease M5)
MKRRAPVALILPDDNFILVDFDNTGTIVRQHLMVDFVHNGFILESGKIIDFFDVEGIDEITLFVNKADLDVVG